MAKGQHRGNRDRGRRTFPAINTGSGERPLVRAVAAALARAFPAVPISNADARRLVIGGGARVNGRVLTRPGALVGAHDRITIETSPSRLGRLRQSSDAPAVLLFEDEHLVAADKPPGLAMHATADPRRPHLVGAVARKLGVPQAALAVHQRLDAGTSGVVIFGRTAAANRGLAEAFAARAVEKIYLAVVDARQRPDLRAGERWTARDPLAPGGSGRRGRHMTASAAGQTAETDFLVRARRRDRAWVEARPKSGRRHQIRAHLAAGQLPIVGDTRYGGPPAGRLHLHAWRIALAHPVSGQPLQIEAPAPPGWLEGS